MSQRSWTLSPARTILSKSRPKWRLRIRKDPEESLPHYKQTLKELWIMVPTPAAFFNEFLCPRECTTPACLKWHVLISIGRRKWARTVQAHGEEREKGRAPPKEGAEDEIATPASNTSTVSSYASFLSPSGHYLRSFYKAQIYYSASQFCLYTTYLFTVFDLFCFHFSNDRNRWPGLVVDTMINHHGVSHHAGLASLLQLLNAGWKEFERQVKVS